VRYLFLTLILLGQVAMGTTLDFIEVKGVKVPLIHEEDRRLPIISMQLVFRNSGSIKDGANPGLAKLSAKMMNEGSKKRGSIGFAEALDARAIHLSAHAGTETFVFEMGALKEEFDTAISLLTELVEEPNLTQESLKKTKTITIGGLTRKENDYDYVANVALKEILFKGTPLQHPTDGTKESIEAISLENIQNFAEGHGELKRAILVIGGDISLEDAKIKGAKVLSSFKVGTTGVLERFEASMTPKEEVLKRKTEQAYIYFGSPYNMQVGDEEYYKSRVATFILGAGGFGSRLM